MSTRTRYFVLASLLVTTVGLGTGLIAYYVGFPTSAFAPSGGPDELRFVPRHASLVAYANVQEVMASELRRSLLPMLPDQGEGQRELLRQTGINIETDIDRVVACLAPTSDGQGLGAGMVLARGRFNEVKIEALMREHGASVEDYRGRRLILGPAQVRTHGGLSVAFVESGLIALGSTALVRQAIDLRETGENLTANGEMMDLVGEIDDGHVWAAGRFDVLRQQARLPQEVLSQLPPITWFTASGHLNGGIRGVLRAEAADEASANSLRDVARGFLALGKLQAGSRAELRTALDSLQLGGTGKTVALSFEVPAGLVNILGSRPSADQPLVQPRP
jgi:hypothetical protein